MSTVSYKLVPEFPNYRVGDDGSPWRQDKRGDWVRMSTKPGPGGYPLIHFRVAKKRYVVRSLRLLVLKAFGVPRPLGHECMNFPDPDPSNCRIDNLRWVPNGTDQIGTYRAPEKPRHGENNANSRLQPSDVLRIREMADRGHSISEIAERYGVYKGTISDIVRGRRWAHVGGPTSELSRQRGSRVAASKLTERDARKIRQEISSGVKPGVLAKRYGVSVQAIGGIAKGRYWKHVPGPVTDTPMVYRGSEKWNAKLKEADIQWIRELRATGESVKDIASVYGVHHNTIYMILEGKIWKHVSSTAEFAPKSDTADNREAI